jgi:hypothetical protein
MTKPDHSLSDGEDGWRPIETAPKDGSEVLILDSEEVVHHASYDGPSDGAIYGRTPSTYNWFSRSCGQTISDHYVTHWRPLPAPPGSETPAIKEPAAPDLLEALKGLVEEVCDYATINKLGDPEQKHNVKLARAAIAKAEAPPPNLEGK